MTHTEHNPPAAEYVAEQSKEPASLVVLAIGLVTPLCIGMGVRLSLQEPTYPGSMYRDAIHAAHPELDDLPSGWAYPIAPETPAGALSISGHKNVHMGKWSIQRSMKSRALPVPQSASRAGWHPCSITTYGHSYHGKRTASGSRYDDHQWTVAVPPTKKGSKRPMVPYGTKIDLTWKGKTLKGLVATDLCPGGTWDVTRKAMIALLGHYEDTVLRGAKWRVSK